MQNVVVSRLEPALNRAGFDPVPDAECSHHQHELQEHTDQQFIVMLDAYRSSGGLARAQEVVALFKRRSGHDLATLASWIVNKNVICFEWQLKMWLPLFQFNRLSMAPQPGLSQVLAQLIPDHDGWALANWFAQPNAWLGNRTPAVMLGLDPAAVLNASRAARLIANG
jgi:hypothetical protein